MLALTDSSCEAANTDCPITDWRTWQRDPALLEIPPELHDQRLLKLFDENTPAALDAAVAHLDARNAARPPGEPAWQYFIYTSQHLPTPDKSNALGRFFVFVPGPSFDRYLQFGLRDDPANPVPDSVSMVTMQTADPGTGERLPQPRAYIEDFWRTRKGGKVDFSTRLARTGHLENCYECHKQPLLHVVPAKATFDAARWGATLQEINARRITEASAARQGSSPPGSCSPIALRSSARRSDVRPAAALGDQGVCSVAAKASWVPALVNTVPPKSGAPAKLPAMAAVVAPPTATALSCCAAGSPRRRLHTW